MKAVLTGATGYIGGRLLQRLLRDGWTLCAVVHPADLTALPEGVLRIEDPHNAGVLASALSAFAPDAVFHLAASQDLADTPDASDTLIDTNLAFGGRVLAAARASQSRAFVAAGTYSSHADGTSAYAPQTLYAATKCAFGDLALHYRRNTELPTVILEFSDTYGPGDDRPKFMNLAASAARTRTRLDASPGEQILRPLHVDDVVSALVHAAHALLKGESLDPVHSVAGTEPVTLKELVAALEQATALSVPIQWGARPYRSGEIMSPYAGNGLPGWQPEIRLAVGLAEVYGKDRSR